MNPAPFSSPSGAPPPRRGIASAVAAVIATWFGAGLMPRAPGTMGTLAAVPLALALDRLGPLGFGIGFVVVTLIGTWAADDYCRATRQHDNQRIVVDEVAGYLLTLIAVPRSALYLLLGFILFRIFDIAKPPPIRWIDRHVHGGIGVMADDLGAGVYGGVLLWLLHHSDAGAALGRWFGGISG